MHLIWKQDKPKKLPTMITNESFAAYKAEIEEHQQQEEASQNLQYDFTSYEIFGAPIEQAVQLNLPHQSTDIFSKSNNEELKACDIEYHRFVPLIVLKCVVFLNKYGLDEEGLYRLSGGNADIIRLRQEFVTYGPTFDLDPSTIDVHTVASLLKQYLREIPHDIFPIQKNKKWSYSGDLFAKISTALELNDLAKSQSAQKSSSNSTISHQDLSLLREELSLLPYFNFALLKVLVRHFSLVISHSSNNLMDLHNMSLILSPTLRIRQSVIKMLLFKGEDLWRGIKPRGQIPRLVLTIDNIYDSAFLRENQIINAHLEKIYGQYEQPEMENEFDFNSQNSLGDAFGSSIGSSNLSITPLNSLLTNSSFRIPDYSRSSSPHSPSSSLFEGDVHIVDSEIGDPFERGVHTFDERRSIHSMSFSSTTTRRDRVLFLKTNS